MEQNNNKSFELFRQWLEFYKPKSASEIAANIRALAPLVETLYVHDEKIGKLHAIYGQLAKASQMKSLDCRKEVLNVKDKIGIIYNNIVNPERRKHTDFNNCPAGQIKKYQTAFLDYVRFLSSIWGLFTLSELEEEGFICRKRRNDWKMSSGTIMTAKMFRRGLFNIFKKFKLLSASDSNMITMSLDTLQEVLDAYARMHGANIKEDLFTPYSFMTSNQNKVSSDWESIFVSNLIVEVGGMPLHLVDIETAIYNEEHNELIITDSTGDTNRIEVPRTSIMEINRRRPSNLSLRILAQRPLREQLFQVGYILDYCSRIMGNMQEFKKVLDSDLAMDDKKVQLPKALSDIDYRGLCFSAHEALHALADYASGFRVEFVAG